MIERLPSSRHALCGLGLAILLAASAARASDLGGRVVEVATGDGFVVEAADGARHKVRLAGIDAPEPRQAYGKESRQGLSALLLGRRVNLERRKEDSRGRIVARVTLPPPDCPTCPLTRDAALAQLEAGLAWWLRAERREQPLPEQGYYEYAEFDARARRIGLWRDDAPVPPWEWRKRMNKRVLTELMPRRPQG